MRPKLVKTIPQARVPGVEKLLSEDHDDLDLLLSAVFAALDVHDPKDVLARLDLFWARLAMHIRSENLQLFPAINDAMETGFSEHHVTAGEKSDVNDALAKLRDDHDFFMRELASKVNGMREATSVLYAKAEVEMTELEQTLTELRRHLKAHNQLEEEIVYRLPGKLLDKVKQSLLADGVAKELENLPPRFKDRARHRRPK